MHFSTVLSNLVNARLSCANPLKPTLTIPDGFGHRLREERERLGLSQTALAGVAGIKRLAQSQYEKESSSPSVRYLAAIAPTGINLDYVLFGRTAGEVPLTSEEIYRIDAEAFQAVEAFVQNQPGGQFGAEGRFALFQAFRSQRIEETLKRRNEPALN